MLIPPEGIVDVAKRMSYPIGQSHGAFEMAANILRNRVHELEREVDQYKHAIKVMDECRLALLDAKSKSEEELND